MIYDPDRLLGDGGGGGDARTDASKAPTLTGIEARSLVEGAGVGGSRPAVVRLLGTGLGGGVAFYAQMLGGSFLEIVDREVSADGHSAVLAIQLPIDATFGSGVRTLAISIGNSSADPVTTEVTMLPELTLAAETPTAPYLYSMIRISGATHIPGGIGPLILHSTSSIIIDAGLDVDAGDGVGRGACVAGPACPGGGQAGVGGFGGGGGGFGSTGGGGRPLGSGGAGGAAIGEPMLVPLGADANRGQPGGRGFEVAAEDASGGGGAGALGLWSEGDVSITAGAHVSAAGGAGKSGVQSGVGGGGGGGSGGAVLIHAGGTLHAFAGAVDCPGGAGAHDQFDGGDGGGGRVRIDAAIVDGASGAIDKVVAAGEAYRGPSFVAETPLLSGMASIDIDVVGTPGATLILTGADEPLFATPDMAGSGRFASVPLAAGIHRLCVTVAGLSDDPLGLSCIDLAVP